MRASSTAGKRGVGLLRWALVLALVAAAVTLAWPRPAHDCSTYGRAADYQSTPATLGTGVTCVR